MPQIIPNPNITNYSDKIAKRSNSTANQQISLKKTNPHSFPTIRVFFMLLPH